jgi:hypothetical protein
MGERRIVSAIPVGNGWNKKSGVSYAIELDKRHVAVGPPGCVQFGTMPILRVTLQRRCKAKVISGADKGASATITEQLKTEFGQN